MTSKMNSTPGLHAMEVDYIKGSPYVMDTRTGRVYINHNRIVHRDYLKPYFGAVDSAGFALNAPETVSFKIDKIAGVKTPFPTQTVPVLQHEPSQKVIHPAPKKISEETLIPVQEESQIDPISEDLAEDMKPLEGGKFIQVGISDSTAIKDSVKGTGEIENK